MVIETQRKYPRTNIFIIDGELWAWAQYRAKLLKYSSVSEYLFELIKLDNQGHIKLPQEILARMVATAKKKG